MGEVGTKMKDCRESLGGNGGEGGAILLGEALSIIGLIAAVLSSAVLQPNRRRPGNFRPWVAMPL